MPCLCGRGMASKGVSQQVTYQSHLTAVSLGHTEVQECLPFYPIHHVPFYTPIHQDISISEALLVFLLYLTCDCHFAVSVYI